MSTSGPTPMEIDKESDHKDNVILSSLEGSNQLSEEEEARQAIEKLRGDDVSARVEAAYKLETVAKT